eukprot:3876653-Prymnesium_polylepis.1
MANAFDHELDKNCQWQAMRAEQYASVSLCVAAEGGRGSAAWQRITCRGVQRGSSRATVAHASSRRRARAAPPPPAHAMRTTRPRPVSYTHLTLPTICSV